MPMTSRQGITNRSKAKSKNARNRGPTPRFPANRILYRDNFCLSLRPICILHGRQTSGRNAVGCLDSDHLGERDLGDDVAFVGFGYLSQQATLRNVRLTSVSAAKGLGHACNSLNISRPAPLLSCDHWRTSDGNGALWVGPLYALLGALLGRARSSLWGRRRNGGGSRSDSCWILQGINPRSQHRDLI
ncbi:hypothetical protein ABIF38_008687 [Bradyrhizobium japonicum]